MEYDFTEAIALMKEGKEEGFNMLYSATCRQVYFRAKQCTRTEEDAEDVTQITFIEAYKNIDKLKSPEATLSWLYTICYHQSCKMYRREQDKREVLLTEEHEDYLEAAAGSGFEEPAGDEADQRETAEIIRGIIEELPELQRMTVIAFYYDGLKLDEIAEMMDCSVNTVKSRLVYARKYIKDRVEEDEKKGGYRLHVFALPAFLLAFKILSERTTLTRVAAEEIYGECCKELGLEASQLHMEEKGKPVPQDSGITANATKAATKASLAGAKSAAATVKSAGAVKALIFAGAIALAGAGIFGGIYLYRQAQEAQDEQDEDRKNQTDKEQTDKNQSAQEDVKLADMIGEWTSETGSLLWIATTDGCIEGATIEFIKEHDIGWSDAELYRLKGRKVIFKYRGDKGTITVTFSDSEHMHIGYEIYDDWGGVWTDSVDYTLTRAGYEYYQYE